MEDDALSPYLTQESRLKAKAGILKPKFRRRVSEPATALWAACRVQEKCSERFWKKKPFLNSAT